MQLLNILLTLLITIWASKAANILGLLAVPSKSHHIWNRSLMLALAARGHKVTVLTTDAEINPAPNYKQHIIANAYSNNYEAADIVHLSPFKLTDLLIEFNTMICEHIFSVEGTKEILNLANDSAVDLIIADVTMAECLLGFVHAFGRPPLVGITAYSHPLWASYMTSNPHNPAYVPELVSSFSDHMSFWQRLSNTAYHLYTSFMYECLYLPSLDTMVREYFGEGVPSVRDIRNSASLVLVNTHASFDHPRPLVPAIVEVAGMHIGPNKTLPQHLKIQMDEAIEGFIYFSLGSYIRSDKMPADRRQVFLDAFSKLPYKVFWKWVSDSLPGQPSNVIVDKWMPQRDILAHPNILLFISHNGLLSTQEAIYNGVPIIGVPFFSDQEANALKSKSLGFAESIDYATVTADQFLSAVHKVVSDHRYRDNARRLSKLMRDQPQTPLERAVFWTEYVIRHKGAPHLRSAALDLPLYQYLLLDVVSVLAVGAIVVLLLLYKTCRVIVALVMPSSRPAKQKKH